MPVLVAGGRTDVVGGRHPATVVVEPAQDEDEPEPRQLVVVGPDRRPAELFEDVVEGVRVDRRREAVADARRPDRDPGFLAPGVDGQVVGQLLGHEDGRVGADRLAAGRLGQRRALPAQLAGLRQPVEGLAGAGQLAGRDVSGQEVEERMEEGRLAGVPSAAATMTGTRPSMSTHSVAASSASSVPDRMSSTMERGVGGTGRKVHPARRGVASASGARRALRVRCGLGMRAYDRPHPGERQTAVPGRAVAGLIARPAGRQPGGTGGSRKSSPLPRRGEEPRPTMRAMDLAIHPLTPERLPADLAAHPVRAGRRPEVVLVHATSGCAVGTGPTRRPRRTAPS